MDFKKGNCPAFELASHAFLLVSVKSTESEMVTIQKSNNLQICHLKEIGLEQLLNISNIYVRTEKNTLLLV